MLWGHITFGAPPTDGGLEYPSGLRSLPAFPNRTKVITGRGTTYMRIYLGERNSFDSLLAISPVYPYPPDRHGLFCPQVRYFLFGIETFVPFFRRIVLVRPFPSNHVLGFFGLTFRPGSFASFSLSMKAAIKVLSTHLSFVTYNLSYITFYPAISFYFCFSVFSRFSSSTSEGVESDLFLGRETRSPYESVATRPTDL